jgi:hypothetical protein
VRFGADEATAAIWPLIVDGLLTTATVELWKAGSLGLVQKRAELVGVQNKVLIFSSSQRRCSAYCTSSFRWPDTNVTGSRSN